MEKEFIQEDKFTYININDFLTSEDETEIENTLLQLNELIDEYECEPNKEVETFLKKNAIEFNKKRQAITYLVFETETVLLVGYFTLALKSLTIAQNALSGGKMKRIKRISEVDDGQYHTLPAYLIAQLGKNYTNDANLRITGDELLGLAVNLVQQHMNALGGLVVYLEAEPEQKLLDFYQSPVNGFIEFDRRTIESANKELVRLIRVL